MLETHLIENHKNVHTHTHTCNPWCTKSRVAPCETAQHALSNATLPEECIAEQML